MNDLIGKDYKIIYADPPWSYNDKNANGKRGAEFKYKCMKPAEIEALPVGSIAAPDSTLFLWVTMPMLPVGLRVMEAWGFKYKTVAFTWVKRNPNSTNWHFGLGHWTRSNAELCLLGVKGKPRRLSAGVSQLIDAPREKHSKKPNKVRYSIVKLMGDIPRIELFARDRAKGWEGWGLEYEN